MKAIEGPKTLLEAVKFFADEDICVATLVAARFPDGVIPCPACGNVTHYYLKNRRVWKCRACAKQFSIKVGTIMEDSPIKLSKWLPAIWLLTNAKNGVSSYELARSIGVTQKTGWFMFHRIRAAMKSGTFQLSGGSDGGAVEVDETFIGGAARNMHWRVRQAKGITQGRKQPHKAVVLGLLERGGNVVTFHVRGTKESDLVPLIMQTVKPNSWLNSDANPAYVMLGDNYLHQFVDHANEYVNGSVHTNGIENYWSLLKRTIRGTYVSIEPFHLFRYLDEQAFRFNHRRTDDAGRFATVLPQVSGRRVTWKQLTGKEQTA